MCVKQNKLGYLRVNALSTILVSYECNEYYVPGYCRPIRYISNEILRKVLNQPFSADSYKFCSARLAQFTFIIVSRKRTDVHIPIRMYKGT